MSILSTPVELIMVLGFAAMHLHLSSIQPLVAHRKKGNRVITLEHVED